MRYLIIGFMLSGTFAFGQVVNIPDATFKAYLVSHPLINTNLDTEIQVSEAQAYAGSLDVSNMGIHDLTGIEEFTTLWQLVCIDNNLSSLDVSGNTALEELHCKGNNISSLDVSNNIALIEMQCASNNISSLNVSANVNLDRLWCNDNGLDTLIVAGAIELDQLYCWNNNLCELDISANTNLGKVLCNGNNLHNLDLRNGINTSISDGGIHMENNPNLTCVAVDDSAYCTFFWTSYIDPQTYFSTNCTYVDCIVGIQEYNQQQFTIYPNPTTGHFTIQGATGEIQVYDLFGRLLLRSTEPKIDMSSYPAGLYIWSVGEARGKLVKE